MKIGVADGGRADELCRTIDPVLTPAGASRWIIDQGGAGLGDADALIVTGDALPAAVRTGIADYARAGGPVLGIGSGFRLLCELELLEGTLNAPSPGGPGGEIWCVVEGRPTPFTQAIPCGRHIRLSAGEGPGRYHHTNPQRLADGAQILFRYATADGEVCEDANPNGSVAGVAGLCNEAGNVVGLAPSLGALAGAIGGDGRSLIQSLLAWKRGTPARVGL